MTPQVRALLIGMLGPVLQALGVTWDLLEHGVLARGELQHLTMEHIVSGPAHLVMFSGFMVSIVCIPIALQVAAARPEEIEAAQARPPAKPLSTVRGRRAEAAE